MKTSATLKLAEEERVCRGKDSEEDLEIEIFF